MKYLTLTNGKQAAVDDEDYQEVIKHNWYCRKIGKAEYAATSINGKFHYLHRFIIKPQAHEIIDHKNRDGLDNRRSNLRICSRSENNANSIGKGGSKTSKYKGVYKHAKGKWQAELRVKGVNHYLGLFINEEDAAKAYDNRAKELFGEFAYINFKNESN
jgi:hypothetical protein